MNEIEQKADKVSRRARLIQILARAAVYLLLALFVVGFWLAAISFLMEKFR